MTDRNHGQNTVILRLLNVFSQDKTDARAREASQAVPVEQVCLACGTAVRGVGLHPQSPGVGASDPLILLHMPDSDSTALLSGKAQVAGGPLLSNLAAPNTTYARLAIGSTKKPAAVKPEQFRSPRVLRASTAPPQLESRTTRSLVTRLVSKVPTHPVPPSIAARIPITRRKAAGLNLSAFAREMKSLAGVSGVSEGDILWIGLYQSVPLAQAGSMEIDHAGRLALYLKPNGLKLPARVNLTVIDLAVGRNRSTGAVIKAVMNQP